MTMVVFLLHPWTHLIKAMHCTPRSLADDLLLFSIGPDHASRVQAAYAATFGYLHALGAKISAAKCYLFSTCPTTRAILRDRYCVHIGAKVQVLMSMRDLGGTSAWARGYVAPPSTSA